jgi:transketolase
MRTSLLKRVVELARNNERICLVVDDLGFSVVDPFVNEFPERFLNAGISEQAMMGISTGWSLAENKIVFVQQIRIFSLCSRRPGGYGCDATYYHLYSS